jgi:hypothetical protein
MRNRPFNLEREKLAPINWRRGMFRLWILASAAWMMGWLIYMAIEFAGGEASARDLWAIPIMLFGPPIALLVFGFATRWAFRGFES